MKTGFLIKAGFALAFVSRLSLFAANADAPPRGGGRGGGGASAVSRSGGALRRGGYSGRGGRGHGCGGLFGGGASPANDRSSYPALCGKPDPSEWRHLLPMRFVLVQPELRERKRRLCRDQPAGLTKPTKRRPNCSF